MERGVWAKKGCPEKDRRQRGDDREVDRRWEATVEFIKKGVLILFYYTSVFEHRTVPPHFQSKNKDKKNPALVPVLVWPMRPRLV